ncbi:MAG: hypothetical protein KDD36_08380, partial [Flavobacteriales bacterium]|nr:hypothetical protein [Flavobacteriales bacterium]
NHRELLLNRANIILSYIRRRYGLEPQGKGEEFCKRIATLTDVTSEVAGNFLAGLDELRNRTSVSDKDLLAYDKLFDVVEIKTHLK